MDDKTLLELAAKAAGITLADDFDSHIQGGGVWIVGRGGRDAVWNPLADDGDALRLAVKLRLEIDHNHPLDKQHWVMALPNGRFNGPMEEFSDDSQRGVATRRAIVRAAAAIGKEMKDGE